MVRDGHSYALAVVMSSEEVGSKQQGDRIKKVKVSGPAYWAPTCMCALGTSAWVRGAGVCVEGRCGMGDICRCVRRGRGARLVDCGERWAKGSIIPSHRYPDLRWPDVALPQGTKNIR